MDARDNQEKQYEIKITRHAEQSMREIAVYIAVDLAEPGTAIKMLKTFQTEIKKLSKMPQRVHLTPEEPWHGLGVRRLRIKNYYAYFWIDETKLKVQVMEFDMLAETRRNSWKK